MDTIPKNNLLNLVQDALNTTSTSSALVVQTSLTTTTVYAPKPQTTIGIKKYISSP